MDVAHAINLYVAAKILLIQACRVLQINVLYSVTYLIRVLLWFDRITCISFPSTVTNDTIFPVLGEGKVDIRHQSVFRRFLTIFSKFV